MSQAILAIDGLEAGYEPGSAIVRGISLEVKAGEIVTILGPNGAGKSTLIKAIAGLVPKFSGSVALDGEDITDSPAHVLAHQGLGFVPQTENVFTLMSIADNLRSSPISRASVSWRRAACPAVSARCLRLLAPSLPAPAS